MSNRPIRATYRLQFTGAFRFEDAEAIVPYLDALGISHVYASPIFTAKPGTLSGYDTCDFSTINPELGGEPAFRSLVSALHAHKMGLIFDFVPNHMSAHPQWNRWWRHVLANGPSSPLSEYFDIDWYPKNSNLHGKVLLAVLGGQYGEVLESGALRVEYRDAEFCLMYGDLNLPLNPRQMRVLLAHRWNEAATSSTIEPEVRVEFESILFHLDHIPAYLDAGPQARVDRERESRIATERLTRVMEHSPALRSHLDTVIAEFNGKPGDAASFTLLHNLLQQQPYRLSYWRTAMHEINYRRFFDVNDLIGLRMEFPPLFESAHAKLIALIEEGLVDGVRLDHIDGLLDPKQYLLQLREATRNTASPLYLVVEKILARKEWISADWPVEGSTGYDYLALLNGLWVQEDKLPQMERIYRVFSGHAERERDALYEAKRLITTTSMASELNVLAHELNRLSERSWKSRDFTLDGLREALREVVACFPVYRTYISERGFSPTDEAAIQQAIQQAMRRNPTLEESIFAFIRSSILPVRGASEPAESFAQRLRFAMKFQQYTSPVQAKGMEDTVFYRYSPLASLNEVGSAVGRRATRPQEFHEVNLARMERWPDAMLTTSTHDTKHGEDARVRISVLSEIPGEWEAHLDRWANINAAAKREVDGLLAPDAADEYLYYQNLLGAWPPNLTNPTEDLVSRMKRFMDKALKEAKVHTSWINPSNEYDAAMERFIESTLRGAQSSDFLKSFVPFAQEIAKLGAWQSISQIAIKMMSPGVVDTYQGGELWDLSLVDPDNRNAVDYKQRDQRLSKLQKEIAGAPASQRSAALRKLTSHWPNDDLKMLYVAAGLQFRARYPELLRRGNYIALTPEGEGAEHVIAFARQTDDRVVITVALRWFAALLSETSDIASAAEKLKDCRIDIKQLWPEGSPSPEFENVLTGTKIAAADGSLQVAQVMDGLPAVWLTVPAQDQKA